MCYHCLLSKKLFAPFLHDISPPVQLGCMPQNTIKQVCRLSKILNLDFQPTLKEQATIYSFISFGSYKIIVDTFR